MPDLSMLNALSPGARKLLSAEMAEQATWSTSIPSWHPRNEEETPEQKEAREKAAREAAKQDNDQLGEKGLVALQRERDARKLAEQEAKDAKKELDALKAEKLSDTEKLQKKAEDGEKLATTGIAKLRRANLLLALAEKGLTGGQAKAAAKLVDVTFNADDEPEKLDAAIEAAKAEYGSTLFAVTKSDPTPDPKDPKKDDPDPNLHGGPRKESKKDAEIIDAWVTQAFPSAASEQAAA
jgi:hypothetical protein